MSYLYPAWSNGLYQRYNLGKGLSKGLWMSHCDTHLNSNTQEAEAEWSWVLGHPGLYKEMLSQNKPKNNPNKQIKWKHTATDVRFWDWISRWHDEHMANLSFSLVRGKGLLLIMGWDFAVIPQGATRARVRCDENKLSQSPTFMSFTIDEVLFYTKDGFWATLLCPFG